jgi:hypothetical protein
LLRVFNQKRVILPINSSRARERAFKQFLDAIVTLIASQKLLMQADPARVSIDNKYGVVTGIKKHGICRLGANAFERQKIGPDLLK